MNPVQLYKCLSDETRLKCLLLMEHEEEICVCELTAALEEIQPKISRHLALLKKCGMIQDRRQGQWVFYRVSDQLPQWARQVISGTLSHNPDFIDAHLKKLCGLGERPERKKVCR